MKHEKLTIIVEHGKSGVPADAFVMIVRRTLVLLRGLDRVIDKKAAKRDWTIARVSMNSPLHIDIKAPQRTALVKTDRALVSDLKNLERGLSPDYMTTDLQSNARALVAVLGGDILSIEYRGGGLKIRPTQKIANAVESMRPMSSNYSEIGSVEGSIEVASVHGRDLIRVWDARFDEPVNCLVTPRQFNEALGYLKHRSRVSVRGRIRFANHRPRGVDDVFDIRQLPAKSNRVDVKNIRPINLYGSTEPASYLRSDGDD